MEKVFGFNESTIQTILEKEVVYFEQIERLHLYLYTSIYL